MALVRICLRCGFVNDWKYESCRSCGRAMEGPGFKRRGLSPGMRVEIKPLDPTVTAERLGKGRVFVIPEPRTVGVLRHRLVTGIGFLRDPGWDRNGSMLGDYDPSWQSAAALVDGVLRMSRSASRVVRDVFVAIEWFVRLVLEAIGRKVFKASSVVEAKFDNSASSFWKVSGRRELNEAIEDIAAALERGERDPQIDGVVQLHID